MERTISIGGHGVKMKATAGTPKRYYDEFGGNLLVEMSNLESHKEPTYDDVEMTQRLAYVLAKACNDKIEPYDEWLDQFGLFDIFGAWGDIRKLWEENTRTTVEPKKK